MRRAFRRLIKGGAIAANRRFWRAAAIGVAAGIENELFLRTQRFDTLIDVGANKGQFALVARARRPDAWILSFEPVAEAVAKFETVFKGDPRTELFRCAVGSDVGTASIRIPANNGEATLVVPLQDVVRTDTVPITTLDQALGSRALAKPILLKLDVQGFELEVLKGAQATLLQIDDLYVEVAFQSLAPRHPTAHEIILWLNERGFEVAGVYNPVSAGTVNFGADIHFRRTGSPVSNAERTTAIVRESGGRN
jgi:FkbM family methyltransferase